MMTARQFASKYPGEVVKIAAKHAKGLGIKDTEPVGIVVGFKIGRLGEIGSSKVAVWHGDYGLQMGLNPKTQSKYNPVVANPPKIEKGIYFLSVDYLELLNPPKEKKPVVVYPNRCNLCGSPCRKGGTVTICSNDNCKSKRAARNAIGPILKFYTLDKNGYVICPTCQVDKLDFQDSYGKDSRYLRCDAQHKFTHFWKDGHKMNHRGTHKYIWQNGALGHYVEKKKK